MKWLFPLFPSLDIYVFIGAVSALSAAATTSFQVIGFCENHQPVFHVVQFFFSLLFIGAHGLNIYSCIRTFKQQTYAGFSAN